MEGRQLNSSSSGQVPVAGSCEHINETLGSVQKENRVCLGNYYLLMNDTDP